MRISSLVLTLGLVCLTSALTGCASFRWPSGTSSNPLFVRASSHEIVWEGAVDALHENQFEILRENRLAGVMETRYKPGAGLLEPWHSDSPDFHSRLESTLQSIRRKAFVTVTPAEGGFFVGVEAYKEIEDVVGAANSAGAATFLDNSSRTRDLRPVVGQAAPSGWIPRGRDHALEQLLLGSLRTTFPQ